MKVAQRFFEQSQIKAISLVLGGTNEGLTGNEIAHLLLQAKIPDLYPQGTKWKRLHNAFCDIQNHVKNRTNILQFIRCAMKPANFVGNNDRYENLRIKLNTALALCGLEVRENGNLVSCDIASTLTEAEERASQLCLTLKERDIHPDVLKFCRAELIQNNYFHAVFEAVKSVFDKLRNLTGVNADGHELANNCLGGSDPKIKINNFITESETTEQKGFNDLVKGVYSMFRSPLAHEAKINWMVTKKDAEDLLTLTSLIHRRIDNSKQ